MKPYLLEWPCSSVAAIVLGRLRQWWFILVGWNQKGQVTFGPTWNRWQVLWIASLCWSGRVFWQETWGAWLRTLSCDQGKWFIELNWKAAGLLRRDQCRINHTHWEGKFLRHRTLHEKDVWGKGSAEPYCTDSHTNGIHVVWECDDEEQVWYEGLL